MISQIQVQKGFSAAVFLGNLSVSRPSSGPVTQSDFSSELRLRVAEFQSQKLSSILGTSQSFGSVGTLSILDGVVDVNSIGEVASVSRQSLSGRNTALFDPESAYQMMTEINTREVRYKAEYVEMTDMRSELDYLRAQSLCLSQIDGCVPESDVLHSVQAFADRYNDWIDRFDQELRADGLLYGTQAAQVSQWELEQSVTNRFLGAKYGVNGMRDLGFQIDAVTGMANVDAERLRAMYVANPTGVTGTLVEFGVHFSRSAELLNSPGNFVPNRLENLGRVVDYISNNKASLQAEFGTGDLPRPSGNLRDALVRYSEIQALTEQSKSRGANES